jgi:NAD(P)-dependent dehydrogenase (short-subunit alcohol dehydrogenase family)
MRLALKPLDEQVIVITGASSGIGLVTAKQAARRGACVVLAARNENDLRDATEAIRRDSGRAVYAVTDVADAAQVDLIADTAVREFGRIDTWVNACHGCRHRRIGARLRSCGRETPHRISV